MLKKLVMTVVASLLVLNITGTSVFANENNENELNNYMEQSGYSKEIIEMLDIEQKRFIYDEKATFVSQTEESGLLTEKGEFNSSSSTDISIKSLNNYSQSIVVSKPTSMASGKVEFIILYNWIWKYKPTYTSEDKFGLAWSDDFDAYPGSSTYAYKVTGSQDRPSAYPASCPSTRTNGGSSVGGYDSATPGAGLGWKANLVSSWWTQDCGYYNHTQHSGWGQVKIGKFHKNTGAGDSTSVVGQYFHRQGILSGELGFSGAPSISISYAWTYDASPNVLKQWNWYHKNGG